MTRYDAVVLGLVFLVTALVAAMFAFTGDLERGSPPQDCATIAFAVFAAASLASFIKALGPEVRRRRTH